MRLPSWLPVLLLAFSANVNAQAVRSVPTWPAHACGQRAPDESPRPAYSDAGVLRSWRAPVDVHVARGLDAPAALAVLADAERVVDALARLGVGLPLPDGDRGGTPSFDVYVRPATGTASEGRARAEWLAAGEAWDRATSFGEIAVGSDAFSRTRAVAQAVAEGCVYAAKADAPPAFVRSMGAALMHRALDVPLDADDVRAFQADPAAGWWWDGTRSAAAQRGGAIVLDAMAERWDEGGATFLRGLLEAPVQRTPPGWPLLWDEPDVFDVLKRVTRDEPRGVWGALLFAASARSLEGTAGGTRDVGGVRDGSLVAAPLRSVGWEQLPTWSVATGIAPTGSASVEISLLHAPRTGSVGVWVHASPYTRWMASVLRIGADGRLVGTLDSELIDTGEWATSVDAIEDAAKLVVVVVSAGDETLEPDGEPVRDGWVGINVGGR